MYDSGLYNTSLTSCIYIMSTTVVSNANLAASPRRWNIVLWVVQGLLAVMFGMVAVTKLTAPASQITAGGLPEYLVRFIGVSELAGAIGLFLPAMLRIRPHLTLIAAYALTNVMVLAVLFHLMRGETQPSAIGPGLTLAVACAFVAWGRLRKAPIAPKITREAR